MNFLRSYARHRLSCRAPHYLLKCMILCRTYHSGLTWPNLGSKWTPGCVVLRGARGDAGERGSQDCRYAGGAAANDNGEAEARIDAAVVTLARLIGRRIAREELDRLDAANDNAPDTEAHER